MGEMHFVEFAYFALEKSGRSPSAPWLHCSDWPPTVGPQWKHLKQITDGGETDSVCKL